MPKAWVNSLGSIQSSQVYPSLPSALSYLLHLVVTLHLIHSAYFLSWPYTVYTAKLSHLDPVSIPPSFHLLICLSTCVCPASLLERTRQS